MNQSDNRIFTSSDGHEIFVPCGCGELCDYLSFVYDADEADPDESMHVSAYVEASSGWRYRLRYCWRILRGKPHYDSIIMSLATTKALRDWLDSKVKAREPLSK